ncbi:alpha/beta hydrolase [Patescibacteria group bacterium]|nr:alpha/beta hydrolase [Patescibacteria group bacterium]
MTEEKVILINNLKVNFKIEGEGEPLLILHGWGGSSDSWIEVRKILANQGFLVICLDLPGFGKSISPPIPWTVRDYSDFLLNFIKNLKLEKIILMGHSFGGRITIKFARLYPEKLKNLILCASAGIKHSFNTRQKIFFNLARLGNFLFSKGFLKRFKDSARNIFYLFLRQRDYQKVKGVMKETFKKVVAEDLLPELSQIKTKTLIIWGERDKSVPLEDAYLMKERIPHSILEIIPKAPHTPNLEVPEKLAEIITHFLRS